MTGNISEDIATVKYLHVIRGVAVKGHAQYRELIFPVSTARRKMCMSKVCTVGNSLGWASRILTLRDLSCGAMEHLMTSITGRKNNQTTFVIRIVFIPLVSLRTITTNGTISTVQTVIDSPARKVRLEYRSSSDRLILGTPDYMY